MKKMITHKRTIKATDLYHFRLPNSSWALKTAQTNVERHYPVLGILEEIKMTLSVMESKLPYFFKKFPNIYYDTFIGEFSNILYIDLNFENTFILLLCAHS